MIKKVELDHYTGEIIAAAIAKDARIRNAGLNDKLFESAQEIKIPDFDGRYNISDMEIESKHSCIKISFEENGEKNYIHAKFCKSKLVLTKKDAHGNNIASNTMQLAS